MMDYYLQVPSSTRYLLDFENAGAIDAEGTIICITTLRPDPVFPVNASMAWETLKE